MPADVEPEANDGRTALTILFLAANPVQGGHLALDEEFRSIRGKVVAARRRSELRLVSEWAARVEDLQTSLLELSPTVLHFSGHGADGSEGLVFCAEDGGVALMTADALDAIFRVLKENIRLVVLNACFSEPQAAAIAKHVGCVVGMRNAIGDAAAIAFAEAFYEAVAYGRSVRDAFDLGVAAIKAHGVPEDATPRLLVRVGVDPGTVYVLPRPERRASGRWWMALAGCLAVGALAGAAWWSARPTRSRMSAYAEPDVAQQRAMIERRILRSLGLPRGAALTPEALARVAVLDLDALGELEYGEAPLNDAGLAWLARPETGLRALQLLILSGTEVTDAGMKEIARPGSGFGGLRELILHQTGITDKGVEELARAGTALGGLRSLSLSRTKVGDAGLIALASPGSGLSSLTSLDLACTAVTDAGVMDLASTGRGLRALRTIDLQQTAVTDAGVQAMCRPGTAIGGLTSLTLLKTGVTDGGLREIARPDTGLPSITTLNIGGTAVTDSGMEALARPDSGIKLLTTLIVKGSKVTRAGLMRVRERFPGLSIIAGD